MVRLLLGSVLVRKLLALLSVVCAAFRALRLVRLAIFLMQVILRLLACWVQVLLLRVALRGLGRQRRGVCWVRGRLRLKGRWLLA